MTTSLQGPKSIAAPLFGDTSGSLSFLVSSYLDKVSDVCRFATAFFRTPVFPGDSFVELASVSVTEKALKEEAERLASQFYWPEIPGEAFDVALFFKEGLIASSKEMGAKIRALKGAPEKKVEEKAQALLKEAFYFRVVNKLATNIGNALEDQQAGAPLSFTLEELESTIQQLVKETGRDPSHIKAQIKRKVEVDFPQLLHLMKKDGMLAFRALFHPAYRIYYREECGDFQSAAAYSSEELSKVSGACLQQRRDLMGFLLLDCPIDQWDPIPKEPQGGCFEAFPDNVLTVLGEQFGDLRDVDALGSVIAGQKGQAAGREFVRKAEESLVFYQIAYEMASLDITYNGNLSLAYEDFLEFNQDQTDRLAAIIQKCDPSSTEDDCYFRAENFLKRAAYDRAIRIIADEIAGRLNDSVRGNAKRSLLKETEQSKYRVKNWRAIDLSSFRTQIQDISRRSGKTDISEVEKDVRQAFEESQGADRAIENTALSLRSYRDSKTSSEALHWITVEMKKAGKKVPNPSRAKWPVPRLIDRELAIKRDLVVFLRPTSVSEFPIKPEVGGHTALPKK
jgi:hypothetical protein